MTTVNSPINQAAAPKSTRTTPFNMLEHKGEWYYPLTEDAYSGIVRAESALSTLCELFSCQKGGTPTAEQIGDLIAYPALGLHEVLQTIHSFKR